MKHRHLENAKKAKNDEFYTLFADVEAELSHYTEHFRGKTVYCNCDDPTKSAFWEYFHKNFSKLGLKKLIASCYNPENQAHYFVYTGGGDSDIELLGKYSLEGNGDFRSQGCIELLKKADIVCTNPPFSLFREYIAQLIEYGKKFIIIGNKNAITYKEFFSSIQNGNIWIGYGSPSEFDTPEGITQKINGLSRWFINMGIKKQAGGPICTPACF